MSNSNNKTDVRITSVNRRAGDEWNYKDHANDGVHFLSGTSPAPEGSYYGFINTGSDTVITSIIYI